MSVNLAFKKACSYFPKPNYSRCTDKEDRFQLTDGKKNGSWWVKKSTVGWRWGSTGIEITLDLENHNVIDMVKIHSVGGGLANVEFPEFIALLVSDNGINYSFAGLIDNEKVAGVRSTGNNRVPHVFVLDKLNVGARFVKLIIRPTDAYFFLDEIEVLGRKKDIFASASTRKDLIEFKNSGNVCDNIEDYLELKKTIKETKKFLQEKRYGFSSELYSRASSKIELLTTKFQMPARHIYLPDELHEIQRELGLLRSSLYKEIYGKDFFCFAANPMGNLLAREMVEAGADVKEMEINLWRNESESSALNILNCFDEPIDFRVSLSPIITENGTRLESGDIYSIRRAVFVKVHGIGLLADPLVLQGDKSFRVEPGSVAQIWLTVNGKELHEGCYHSAVAISGFVGERALSVHAIDIEVNVDNVIFPEQSSMNACVWDQYTWVSEITRKDTLATSKDLKDHHVNIGVINPILIPHLRIPYKHKEVFEAYLENRDFYRMHLLYFNWWPQKTERSTQRDNGRFGKWMSSSWKRNFTLWLRGVVKTLREKGVGYDRFAIYPFDESLCDEFYQVAKLIKQIDPQIKIYANDFGRGPKDYRRFKDLVDIWDLHWKHCKAHPDWLEDIKSFGKEVWTYRTAAPSRGNDPYSYYRLMSWDAFARGQTGVGFWIYISRDKQHWDDGTLPRGHYDVVYGQANSPVNTHGEKIIPSKRWEAWREGIEDYEYLVQLQNMIKQLCKSDAEAAEKAETVLTTQVKRVISSRENVNMVYQARKKIVQTLLKLHENKQDRSVND